ncbi:hypothetical protein [Pseudomonas sp. B21-048]|uniref:hypothetical protein n=1 Tax=Pseudomonas sp. B21-048 TaxID=2895490 RepID=UPI00215FC812|nr:hypothetical protein [Pseudomonas sp. B21-048]UVL00220.1 hypothetical protein LOY56_07510 [Pseudomonas sp. B21-048]
MKTIPPDGAGLVGQDLVACLKSRGHTDIVGLDKHRTNLAILKSVHPELTIEYTDLSKKGSWSEHFVGRS